MIFKSKKAFERELDRRLNEIDENRRMWNRMEELQKEIYKLHDELIQLRMRTDEEYRRQNAVACGKGTVNP